MSVDYREEFKINKDWLELVRKYDLITSYKNIYPDQCEKLTKSVHDTIASYFVRTNSSELMDKTISEIREYFYEMKKTSELKNLMDSLETIINECKILAINEPFIEYLEISKQVEESTVKLTNDIIIKHAYKPSETLPKTNHPAEMLDVYDLTEIIQNTYHHKYGPIINYILLILILYSISLDILTPYSLTFGIIIYLVWRWFKSKSDVFMMTKSGKIRDCKNCYEFIPNAKKRFIFNEDYMLIHDPSITLELSSRIENLEKQINIILTTDTNIDKHVFIDILS